jgi:DNA primase
MGSLSHFNDIVKLSEVDIETLPNHKVKSANEWSSACPFCGTVARPEGKDRFLFWPNEGNYWCRQCDISGFINQEAQSTLTDDQRADIERRQRQARQAELDRKRTALQKLQAKRNDIIYHRNLNGKTDYVKQRWGLTDNTINTFKVGYCQECPTSTYSDSITIPYYYDQKLINLRHRLSAPNGNGKYRPEAPGLPTAIFNADMLNDADDFIVLVEGEFKVMVLEQNLLPAIGIPGASIFKEKWLKLFPQNKIVYVALDPGAEAQGLKIATMLSGAKLSVKLVILPTKPDDFFALYGGTYDQFYSYLINGRKI